MPKSSLEALKWLLIIAGNQKKRLITSMVLAVSQVIFSLVPFVVIYHFLVVVVANESITVMSFWWLALVAVVAVLMKFSCLIMSLFLSHKAAFQLLFDLRRLVVANLGDMPLKHFNKKSSSVMQKIVGEDIQRIEVFIAHHLPDMAAAIISPVVVVFSLLFLDWRLALAALVPLPLALIVQRFMFKGFSSRVQKFYAVMARMHVSLVGFVSAISVVKAFNLTVDKQSQLQQVVDEHNDVVNDWTEKGATTSVLFQIVIDSGFLFVAALGLYLLSVDLVTLPTLIIFMLLGIGLMEPMQNLVMFGGLLTEILEGVNRIRQFSEAEKLEEAQTEPLDFKDKSVEFVQVGFSHSDSEKNTLENVSFKAKSGTITALVGPSGAGKSTLIQLIPRLLDATQGDIYIGGININNIPFNQLMEEVSFVFQDTFILNDTVFENIRMGDQSVTKQQVIDAAKKAQADGFINELANGYDTSLGLNGHKLSGGESQRIAIARAILKDSPILVLDEATAFSDAENESLIQRALNTLIYNKTVIVVTHQLLNITEVDQIIVMDKGTIIATGTHQDLQKTCELYNHLWDITQASTRWQLGHNTDASKEINNREGVSYV